VGNWHVLDHGFKRLFGVSDKAKIVFINRLFGKNYAENTKLVIVSNETVDEDLKLLISDMILRFEDGFSYHIEMQANMNKDMVIRMFEYGFRESLSTRRYEDGVMKLQFAEPKVICLGGSGESLKMEIMFPDNQRVLYDVDVLDVLEYDLKRFVDEGFVLLIPFCFSRLFKSIKYLVASGKGFDPDYVLSQSEAVFSLINEIGPSFGLTKEDSYLVSRVCIQVFNYYFSDFKEMREVADMLKEKVKLFLDDELEEAERRGKAEGKAEGKVEVALKLKELGFSQEDIMKATGLGLGDVRKIVSGKVKGLHVFD
jgi:hypothetical protein